MAAVGSLRNSCIVTLPENEAVMKSIKQQHRIVRNFGEFEIFEERMQLLSSFSNDGSDGDGNENGYVKKAIGFFKQKQ